MLLRGNSIQKCENNYKRMKGLLIYKVAKPRTPALGCKWSRRVSPVGEVCS